MIYLGARVVALDVVILQPSLHSLFQVGHVHLVDGEYENVS